MTRTQKTADTLNLIANKMAEIAPELDEATIRNQAISTLIKALIDAGSTVQAAWDTVMGEGSYNELAETVYNAAQV